MSDVSIVRADADRLDEMLRRCVDDEARPLLAAAAAEQPDGAWLALDDGTPIGISIVRAFEDERFVALLHVEPTFRGHGIARDLLLNAGGDPGDPPRTAIVDLAQPDAIAVALRAGLALQTPIVGVAGAIPKDDDLLALAGSMQRFGVVPLDPIGHAYALDAIDRRARGTARPDDHRQRFEGAKGTAFFSDDEFVGYAYIWPSGRIGPLASVANSYVAPFLVYAMASARREHRAAWCIANIPGTNVRALRAATRAGLTVTRTYGLASEGLPPDLECYIGGPTSAW